MQTIKIKELIKSAQNNITLADNIDKIEKALPPGTKRINPDGTIREKQPDGTWKNIPKGGEKKPEEEKESKGHVFNNVKDAENWAIQLGFANSADYSKLTVPNSNVLNDSINTWNKHKYKINSINVSSNRKRKAIMSANFKELNISNDFLSPKSQQRVYNNSFKDYHKNIDKKIGTWESKIQLDNKAGNLAKIPFMEKSIQSLKAEKKYNRFIFQIKGKVVDTALHHEMGHVVSDQVFGLVNPTNKDIKLSPAEARATRQAWGDVFDRMKADETIFKISKYASTSHAEAFAECFSIYHFEKNILPEYVIDFIEEVLDGVK
jgi:hypothetical protein